MNITDDNSWPNQCGCRRYSRGWTCQDNGGKAIVLPVSVETRAHAVAVRIPRSPQLHCHY